MAEALLLLATLLALVHPFVPGSRWLMVHLVLLGALTHSIMVWSTHFSQALLKTRPGLDDRRMQSRRLVLLLVGTTTTVVGVPTSQWCVASRRQESQPCCRPDACGRTPRARPST